MSDDWDFYFCHVDDKPASIFVDLGIHGDVPVPDFTDLVWLRLYMREPREDGLASKEEFDRLAEIEDALGVTARDETERVLYVGRNTSDGTRDFYFYSTNALKAASCLSAAMVPFPEYEFETGSRPDPQWSAYLEFLYPSDRSHQMIMNGQVLESLEKKGDKHEIRREVSHWVYFRTSEDRLRFSEAVQQKGFKSVAEPENAEDLMRFGLIFSHLSAVDYSTINDVVLELFDLAKECHGEYDGWETSVETGE